MQNNVLAPMELIHEVLPGMVKRDSDTISAVKTLGRRIKQNE